MFTKFKTFVGSAKTAIESYYPSSSRVFSKGNLLERLIEGEKDLFDRSHAYLKSTLNGSTLPGAAKLTGNIALFTYKGVRHTTVLASQFAYTALKFSSTISEAGLRTSAFLVDRTLNSLAGLSPTFPLSKGYFGTKKLFDDIVDFMDVDHTYTLVSKGVTIRGSLLKKTKDFAVVASSLLLLYTATPKDKIAEAFFDAASEVVPWFDESLRDKQYDLGIIVGGSKSVLEEGGILDVDLRFNNKGDLRNNDVVLAKYFLLPQSLDVPSAGDLDFTGDMIYVGERKFTVGKGVSGFFTYDPQLPNNFDSASPRINPFANNDLEDMEFEFGVLIYKNGKKLTHKFWGENFKKGIEGEDIKDDHLSFKFQQSIERLIELEDASDGFVNDGEKRFFVYQQRFDRRLRSGLIAAADYIMPHFWDVESTSLDVQKRASDRFMIDHVDNLQGTGTKVLPMISAFKKSYILKILDNPKPFSKQIVDYVQDVGADGVTIDFESIHVGKDHSAGLVEFMSVLRKEFDKVETAGKEYEIAIAVSPRFNGSGNNGYSHHAFYDFKGLDKAGADWIHIMGYDFNVKKVGPGLPEDKIKDIVSYAITHVKNDDKIVFCFPFYGRVYNSNGNQIGAISESGVQSYLSRRNNNWYENGELRIETFNPERIIFTQDPEVHGRRLSVIDSLYGGRIKRAGGWRASHISSKSLKEYMKWLNEEY